MAHFLQSGSHGERIFGIDEARSGFRFLDGGHDGVDDFAVDENRCVERRRQVIGVDWQLWFLGEVEIAAIARACFGFIEVGGVGVEP